VEDLGRSGWLERRLEIVDGEDGGRKEWKKALGI
jgi:hypothetical protein